MVKKFIITMAIISILLLINLSVFAEPINRDLHNKFDKVKDINIIGESVILSVKDANDLLLKETFAKVKNNLDILLMRIKEMVRFRINNNLEYKDTGHILAKIERRDTEKDLLNFNSLEERSVLKEEWDGKDRIISLDFGEEDNIDKFY